MPAAARTFDDVDLDDRRLIHAQHLITIEVRLLDEVIKQARNLLHCICRVMAHNGHRLMSAPCPLLGVKRTWPDAVEKVAFDPKRT